MRDLTGDQFLKLCLAEEEQLLTITINDTIDGLSSNSYIEEVKQLYIKVNIKYVLLKFPYCNNI